MRSFLASALLAATAVAAPIESNKAATSEMVSLSNASAPNMACKPIIMLYARGTWEPNKPGTEIPKQVADPLLKTLEQIYPGKIEFRNVKYDGGAIGYLSGGDGAGTRKFESMTKEAANGCPNSALLLVGYSQGAQVLYNAVSKLQPDVAKKVKAIFMIGDPNWKKNGDRQNTATGVKKSPPVFNNGISNSIIYIHCDKNDNICNGIPSPTGIHDNYTDTVLKGDMARGIAKILGPMKD